MCSQDVSGFKAVANVSSAMLVSPYTSRIYSATVREEDIATGTRVRRIDIWRMKSLLKNERLQDSRTRWGFQKRIQWQAVLNDIVCPKIRGLQAAMDL